jgi:hypothetical protein
MAKVDSIGRDARSTTQPGRLCSVFANLACMRGGVRVGCGGGDRRFLAGRSGKAGHGGCNPPPRTPGNAKPQLGVSTDSRRAGARRSRAGLGGCNPPPHLLARFIGIPLTRNRLEAPSIAVFPGYAIQPFLCPTFLCHSSSVSSSACSAPLRFTSWASRWRETGWKPVFQDRLEAYPTAARLV